jgi:hypothetical protein
VVVIVWCRFLCTLAVLNIPLHIYCMFDDNVTSLPRVQSIGPRSHMSVSFMVVALGLHERRPNRRCKLLTNSLA